MRQKGILITINILAVIIQTSFLSELFSNVSSANLVAAIVISMLILSDTDSAYLSAFVGGLLLDIVSGGIVGLYFFLLTLFVYLYTYLHSFYLRSTLNKILFIASYFYVFKLAAYRTLLLDWRILVGAILTGILGWLLSTLFKGYREKTTY